MTPQESIKKSAEVIVDNIIDLQLALSGQTSTHAMRLMRNIQDQARGLISGSPRPEPLPADGPISQGYRADLMEATQGLFDHILSKTINNRLPGDLFDEELHVIALAAETATSKIYNYLLVKRAEAKIMNQQLSEETNKEIANG